MRTLRPFTALWKLPMTRPPAASICARLPNCSLRRWVLIALRSAGVSLRPADSCALATEGPGRTATTVTGVLSRLIGTTFAAAGVRTWIRWNLLLGVGAADDVAAITMP